MKKRKICIIGGGASGLMAAIMAAREGAEVTLLEHNEKTGRKLLATGNGRCNLTNIHQEPSCYHSLSGILAWEILQGFSLQDTICFFSQIGVYTKNREGYLYPASMQASSVQELLEMEARYRKVKIKCREHVKEIRKDGQSFQVLTETWSYPADKVILAAGSRASSIQGADGSGYGLAEALGHKIIPPLPALVPLKGRGNWFSKWAGVRTEGKVSLMAQGQIFDQAQGEIQLTDYGVSGIPVFQVSGRAIRLIEEGVQVTLLLDFLPDFDQKGLEGFLRSRQEQCPYKSVKQLLIGLLPQKLAEVLMMGKPDISGLAHKIKEFPVEITGSKSWEQAQVCSGVSALWRRSIPKLWNPEKCRGLYLSGEILDADGICGGYNLQWAWSTGAVAGGKAQPAAVFKKERRNFHADFAAGKTAGNPYQRRSGEKNNEDTENFFPGASVLEDPKTVSGCQKKTRTVFCIHNRCFL